MGFFPLTEGMFIESLKIGFDEKSILPEHIERYEKSRIYYLYINSVVVSPDFQKYPVVYGNIFGTFLNSVIELARNDIFFCDACGRATSPKGRAVQVAVENAGSGVRDDEPGFAFSTPSCCRWACASRSMPGGRFITFSTTNMSPWAARASACRMWPRCCGVRRCPLRS